MIEKNIGYVFKDEKLLTRALTHPSKSASNYQRLEFLGDSILNFVVAEYLFNHCKEQEGQLTILRARFVSEAHLAQCFDEMDLTQFVICGKSMKEKVTTAIKGDVVESIIAAMYLDSNLEKVREFIVDKLHVNEFERSKDENFKTQLQELVQANFKCSISYKTKAVESGFESKFYMDDDCIATGYGSDKTKAEQNCAYVAIHKLFEEE